MWAAYRRGPRADLEEHQRRPPTTVTFTRLDTALQPNRAVSSIFSDPTDPNHAIVTFSGYNVTTAATPGHVFDVRYDATGPPTWTDISYDLGDQPVNDAVLDTDTGNIYVSTDFGVFLLEHGTKSWAPVADGMPLAAVSGLTLADAKHGPARFIYAATHGRGAYRIRLHKVTNYELPPRSSRGAAAAPA